MVHCTNGNQSQEAGKFQIGCEIGYIIFGVGLKEGAENNIFWSEIGSGFCREPCGTHPPKMLEEYPPTHLRITVSDCDVNDQ